MNKNSSLASEVYEKSTDQIFQEYYFYEEDIDLQQLVGLQYYNEGIFPFHTGDFQTALSFFEKAYVLYPSLRIRFVIGQAIASLVDHAPDFRREEALLMAKVFNMNYVVNANVELSRNIILDMFQTASYNLSRIKFDYEEHEAIYRELVDNLKDTSLIEEIQLIYYSNQWVAYALIEEYSKAAVLIMKAYALNPANPLFRKSVSEGLHNAFLTGDEQDLLAVDSIYQEVSGGSE